MLKRLVTYFINKLRPTATSARFGAGVYIGWDSHEELAYEVCAYSIRARIKTNTQMPVHPIKLQEMREKGWYARTEDQAASTEFTFTRFLVPFLSKYEGVSIFMDGDFLLLEDIQRLFELYDSRFAVQVVQHNYNPKNVLKKSGFSQTQYPRKNWSSLILWNNAHPKNKLLTPELINSSSPSFLHQFRWLEDHEIGALPLAWNWLVGWNQEPRDGKPKALHFTEGGPWLEEYRNTQYANLWNEERDRLLQSTGTLRLQAKDAA